MSLQKDEENRKHNELREITGNAPWCVLYCEQCHLAKLPEPNSVSQHILYDWAVTITCSTCNLQWNICTACSSSRKPLIGKAALYNHNYRKHRSETSMIDSTMAEATFPSNLDSEVLEVLEDSSHGAINSSHNLASFASVLPPSFGCYSSLESQLYFEQHNVGLGASYLVAKSQFKMPHVAGLLHVDEVNFHLKLSSLLCSLTRGQRDELAILFHMSKNIVLQQHSNECTIGSWDTKIPCSPQQMRSLYIKGKDALLPNLPRPSVRLNSNHAYVSLHDCIADMLGHGLEVENITASNNCEPSAVCSVMQCQFSQSIYNRGLQVHGSNPFICLYITEWSDGFEPSTSTKANRGSCWIKSVTISPSRTAMHKLSHTYPIAIARENASHECVEKLFAEELQNFKRGENITFYHGALKRNVTVYLELLVSLQDQPERRSSNYIMLGGSKYTARWGVSLDIAQVASNIPSCSMCFESLLCGMMDTNSTCSNCLNWETDIDNELLHYVPPINYPQEEVGPNGKLPPIKISYNGLKEAVQLAQRNLCNHLWDKKTALSFLQVQGINKEATDLILNNKWITPAMWERDTDVMQHIDVPMHLLFLGILKTSIQMTQEWMTKRHKSATFVRYSAGSLEGIQQLGLSWCKCLPYKTGKLGGWVSENYLALGRLLPWFYGGIGDVATDEEFIEPSVSPKNWTKKQNQAWLAIRALDTKGTAKVLRNRVQHYMTVDGGPPPLAPVEGGPVRNVLQMQFSLHVLLSYVMQTSTSCSDIRNIDRHIKLFLNFFEIFDKAIRKEGDTPTWITSYNFICLTNLPHSIHRFGPIRNYWEGGVRGEKIIQSIKPLWNGFRKNWAVNIMERMLKQMAIERVLNNSTTKGDEVKIDATGKLCYVYRSVEQLQQFYDHRKPISIVQLSDGTFHAKVTRNFYVELTCESYAGNISGSHYHYWVIESYEMKLLEDTLHIINYCLLLPKMTMTGIPSRENEAIYTAIDYEWKDIQPNKLLCLPEISDILN